MAHLKTLSLLFATLLGTSSAQQSAYGQCGGIGWTGETTCVSGYTCVYANDWYSQCVAGGSGGDATTTVTTTTTSSTPDPTTSSGSGGGGSNTCGSAPVDGLAGYGAGTTGGGSGSGTTVSSCSALESAIEGGGVIYISGILSGCDILDLEADTTVIGLGSNSGMTGGGFRVRRTGNVILRNLKFSYPPEGKDLVSLDNAVQVWIDHCDFSNAGLTGDKDTYDGLVDVSHASDFVTVSWCKFHDHWKASLIGHSDNNADEDTGHLRVTYHHNHWYNCNSRLPSIRFGTGHFYSSCFEDNPTSGINSRMGAQVLVEQCYFSNTNKAIVTNLSSDDEGYATSLNNIFSNSDTDITQTSSLSPPYSYTVDPASCVCDLVKSQAGTGIIA